MLAIIHTVSVAVTLPLTADGTWIVVLVDKKKKKVVLYVNLFSVGIDQKVETSNCASSTWEHLSPGIQLSQQSVLMKHSSSIL